MKNGWMIEYIQFEMRWDPQKSTTGSLGFFWPKPVRYCKSVRAIAAFYSLQALSAPFRKYINGSGFGAFD